MSLVDPGERKFNKWVEMMKPVSAKMDKKKGQNTKLKYWYIYYKSLHMVCGRQPTQCPPMISPPVIYICVILSSWMWAGFTDSLLISRVWQIW